MVFKNITMNSTQQYLGDVELYRYVTINVTMKRKPTYYFLFIIVPLIVLYLLAMLSFAVPCESGEKISISITVLLSYTIFLIMIEDNLPKTSDYIPLMCKYTQIPINYLDNVSPHHPHPHV